MIGRVFAIFFVATTLPSTFNSPVPDWPRPVKLLKASVSPPRPSYLKSNATVCLPGPSGSGASQVARSRSTRFQVKDGLPLLT